MVPEEWEEIQLGRYMSFKNGLNTEKENYGSGIKFVNVMDIFRNEKLFENNVVGAVNISPSQIRSYALMRGDVLFNRTSEIREEIAMAATYLDTKEVVFGGFVIRGRPLADKLVPEYTAYCFKTASFRKEAIRRSQGVIRANIGQRDLEKIPVLVPPKEEQTQIASILEKWDQAIEATGKLIKSSQAQKNALMQQLMTGKRRLPGFSKGWNAYRLGKLFTERKETNRLDLPLLSITQDKGVIFRDDVGRKDTSSEDKSKYKRLLPGDIGYNTMRMWQGVSALSDKEGIVSPAYTIVTPNQRACPAFMAYFFKHPRVVHDFYRYSQGLVSDTWNLKFRHFSEVTVSIPDLEEQQAIAGVLAAAGQYTTQLEGILLKLQAEKKALMQQLLTGKRRVQTLV